MTIKAFMNPIQIGKYLPSWKYLVKSRSSNKKNIQNIRIK